MLTREKILSETDLKKETVTVKEWGGDVIVSEMSGATRDSWEQAIREKDASGRIVSPRAKLIVFTVVDEKGNRIFKDDDIEGIGKLSSEALEKVCAVAMRLNGLGADEINKAKKNS
jgi:hypothetical protein